MPFRHLDNVPGIGGIARIPDIDGNAVLVLYGVDPRREPDRQLVFESLDEGWIGTERAFSAYEIPRGWPERAALMRLVPETDGISRPRWRAVPVESTHEAHAIVDGLKAIGYFDPDHPEAGGRRRAVLQRRSQAATRGGVVVPMFAGDRPQRAP